MILKKQIFKKLTLLLFLMLLILLVGCGKKEQLTNKNVKQVFVNPEEFIESEVNLAGKIVESPKVTDGQINFLFAPDPYKIDYQIKVIYHSNNPKLEKGNFVQISGTINDSFPTITAVDVKNIEPQTILAPTTKQVEFNDVKKQNGYIVTLKKIEFAKTETRVFITIKNASKSKIEFYADYAKCYQNNQEVRPQKNWEAEYPEVPNTIKSQTEVSGIIVFSPLDYSLKKAQLIFEGFSENIFLQPFKFEVKW